MDQALKITAAYFTARVGRPPFQDDLERCNCGWAGRVGHEFCGWDRKTDWPKCVSRFESPEYKAFFGLEAA